MSNPAKQWARVWARIDEFVEDRRDGRAAGTVEDAFAVIFEEESMGDDDE
jgi:hypothetical protein